MTHPYLKNPKIISPQFFSSLKAHSLISGEELMDMLFMKEHEKLGVKIRKANRKYQSSLTSDIDLDYPSEGNRSPEIHDPVFDKIFSWKNEVEGIVRGYFIGLIEKRPKQYEDEDILNGHLPALLEKNLRSLCVSIFQRKGFVS